MSTAAPARRSSRVARSNVNPRKPIIPGTDRSYPATALPALAIIGANYRKPQTAELTGDNAATAGAARDELLSGHLRDARSDPGAPHPIAIKARARDYDPFRKRYVEIVTEDQDKFVPLDTTWYAEGDLAQGRSARWESGRTNVGIIGHRERKRKLGDLLQDPLVQLPEALRASARSLAETC
jgi:hypothetical protein